MAKFNCVLNCVAYKMDDKEIGTAHRDCIINLQHICLIHSSHLLPCNHRVMYRTFVLLWDYSNPVHCVHLIYLIYVFKGLRIAYTTPSNDTLELSAEAWCSWVEFAWIMYIFLFLRRLYRHWRHKAVGLFACVCASESVCLWVRLSLLHFLNQWIEIF